jgi:amino acid adenylation domain-containing protein
MQMNQTFVEVFRQHVEARPNTPAYSFIDEAGVPTSSLTYADLDTAAREIAARLRESGDVRGERVLILQPTGPDFLCAFFGAMYAGAAAMPLALARAPSMLSGIAAILKSGRPRFGIVADEMAQKLAAAGVLAPYESIVFRRGSGAAEGWRMPKIDANTAALVQYTSGSTGVPRGVLVSHENLCHNAQMMSTAFGTSSKSVLVCWLPLFHDMGLIGNVLHSAWLGSHCVLLSPNTFIRRPARWLETITRYRAEFSGAPNFAYDLCVRKISDADRRGLDLSGWRVAFTGAEPVCDETLSRFSHRFAINGFSSRAFYPCYGLAEATVFVSGGDRDQEPRRLSLSAAELARDSVKPAIPGEPQRTLVSCGRSWGSQRIVIVDPQTGRRLAEDRIGEIWIAGKSVSKGYFSEPESTAATFGGHLVDESETFLRTGDLGFIQHGDLFITGRLKDLIIVRGRNHYPQDIESTVERCHLALRPASTICFSIEHDGEERLVVVQEIRSSETEWRRIIALIRTSIFEQHELQAFRVVLVRPGAIEKTSSGKPRRGACRARLRRGELPVLLDDQIPLQDSDVASSFVEQACAEEVPIVERLRHIVAVSLQQPPEAIPDDRSLIDLGIDSLSTAELRKRLRDEFGIDIGLEQLLSATVRTLETTLNNGADATEPCQAASVDDPSPTCNSARPVSATQRRLWLNEIVAPGRHHIPFGIEMGGALDVASLREALDCLLTRHEALRMAFNDSGGNLEAFVVEGAPIPMPIEDLREFDGEAQEELVRKLAHVDAASLFDLAMAPLMRARLLRLATERHLLVVVLHHLVADGWSVGLIVRDLARFYEQSLAGTSRRSAQSAASAWAPSDATQTARARAYWRDKLADAEWSIDLPRVRPRRAATGKQEAIRIVEKMSAKTKCAIDDVARSARVTPFVVLLSAFDCLLHHYSGQNDLSIGTVVAQRATATSRDIVGPLINTVVLRANWHGDPAFGQLLHILMGVVSAALDHAELPFEEVAHEMQANAHRPPFQVMFVYQNFPLTSSDGGSLKWNAIDLDVPLVPFDLTMELRPVGDCLALTIDADSHQFDESALRAIAQHYQRVLDAALAEPSRRLSQLSPWPRRDGPGWRASFEVPQAAARFVPVQRLFSEEVRKRPEAPAVFGDLNWTYEQLDAVASYIALRVRERGGSTEHLVGIHIDQPALRLAAVLGILKAGAAYVPLDVAFPAGRLKRIIDDSRISLVLSHVVVDWCPCDRLEIIDRPFKEMFETRNFEGVEVRPEQLAYVIYTSGSTGEPLGVAVSHGAIAQHCQAIVEQYCLQPSDRILQFASLNFDVSAEEMFPTWSRGGALVTVENHTPDAVRKLAARFGVTVLNLPSRYWELWASHSSVDLECLRLLVVGSETISPVALAAYREQFPHVECRYAYGLVEATVTSMIHPVSNIDTTARVPIGRPLSGTRAHVLDSHMQPVGKGGLGELWLGGAGLARGYLNRPDKTAERFMPDPFGHAGERLLRTGDIVRCRWDGEIDYVGRLDGQAKLRGYRVAPEEVEGALRRAGATEAAVVVRRESLLAYVEVGEGSLAGIRRAAAAELPRYLLPTVWVAMQNWPRTAGGKIDHLRLPDPESKDERGGSPRGPIEETVAAAFAEVLGLVTVTRETDFFEAGGHSLLAMRIIQQMKRSFGVELPMSLVFEAPTVWELGENITHARKTEGHTVASTESPRCESSDTAVLLSASQRRLWFLEMLNGGTAQYNMPLAIVVNGPLDEGRLCRAFEEVIARHEILRMVIDAGRNRPGPRARLEVEAVESWADAEQRADGLARAVFDIKEGPLIRAKVLRASETERLIVIVVHHLVCDGRSLQVMLAEIGEHYRTGSLKPLRGQQYTDYVRGEAARDYSNGLRYWKQQLANSAPTWLPYDSVEGTYLAGRVTGRLPITSSEISGLSRRAGVTTHMALLGAVQVLLSRLSGDEDIRVAIPVANRASEELQATIGCFVNTVVLRTAVHSWQPFVEHLKRVKQTALDAYEYQDTPFDEVVAALRLGRGQGTPLIEVMLLVEEDKLGVAFGESCTTEVKELENGAAKFDFTITVRLRGRTVEAEIEYDTGRFARETVVDFLACFQELSQSIVRAPEEQNGALRILSADAEHVICGWEHGGPIASARMLHDHLRDQVLRTPDAMAVECGARRLSYRELFEKANQVTHGLIRRGIGREALVGLRMSRTEDLIVAMLGILQAGATYVPIDPEYPIERQRYIESDSGVQFTLSSIGGFSREAKSPVEIETQPGRLAYIIYTSGSEGRPKGVGITHGGASVLVQWAQTTYSPVELARVAACTSVCFDLSVFEIFAPLSVGGTIVLVEDALALPDAEGVTLVNTVPSAMSRVLQRLPKSVITVNLAGEVLPRTLVDALYDRGVLNVWNLYGPSEDTTYSTALRVARSDRRSPSIGRPLPGTTAYVLGGDMGRIAKCGRGELYLAGAGLARGYVNQPAKSADRFVPDPFAADGTRVYRTGDWARYRADETLEFLGRRDGQVKVRGYRIEPAEIEDGLRRAGATEAVVAASGERLIAYVETGSSDLAAIRASARTTLPRYLVPTLWVEIQAWPRTASGKIDRKNLSSPDESEALTTAPNGETEDGVAAIFREVLALKTVGRETNFFDSGGHSLLAMQVVERINRLFGIDMPVRDLFEAPAVWELAARVEGAVARCTHSKEGSKGLSAASPKRIGRSEAPLTTAQRRLWFLEQLARGTSLYHVPIAIDIVGPLDVAVLTEAFAAIIQRHEGLRTTFPSIDGVPLQHISNAVEAPISILDFEDTTDTQSYIAGEIERPFILAEGPLFRISVIRQRDGAAVLLLVIHHIICDEWSLGALLREFSERYLAIAGGSRAPPSPLHIQMADYAVWESSPEARVSWDADRSYWATQLSGLQPLRLPGAAFTGTAGERSSRGRYLSFVIERTIVDRVQRLAREMHGTDSMVLLAALDTLLNHYGCGDDIAVGMPTANRRSDTEPLIGFFVNQLVIRVSVNEHLSFTALVQRIREVALAAYSHQHLPFDEVVATVRPKGTRPAMPLVNMQFDVHNAPFGPLKIGELELIPRPVARTTVQFDLQLSIEESNDGMHCFLGFNSDCFDNFWAQSFAADFVSVLSAATTAPWRPISELTVGCVANFPTSPEDFAFR